MVSIGNNPHIKLWRLTSADSADVYVKFKGANPAGSMKDRMALSMFEGAKRLGDLKPGGQGGGIHRRKNGELGPGKKIVTVIIDSGLKYLKGDLYALSLEVYEASHLGLIELKHAGI